MTGSFGDDTLRHYQDELTYLRRMGAEFARKYPKVAARLEIGADVSPDPHVERLLESFAFLTGRLQQRLDAEFPEIPTALLGTLYPHMLDPTPSMAIAEFSQDLAQGAPDSGYRIRRGMPLFAESEDGLTVRFRTCYDTVLWPINVVDAGLESIDQYDFLDGTEVSSLVRIRLQAKEGELGALALDQLRFYINAEGGTAYSLYEQLFANLHGVVVLDPDGAAARFLPADSLRPVGFAEDEALLPQPAQSHPGYRLLKEYFVFPEKFLFFDLTGLDLSGMGRNCDILLLLRRVPGGSLSIDRSTFVHGCTPVINLFDKISEPIRFDHRQAEYLLVPDSRLESITEIHSIHRVSGSMNPDDTQTIYASFFAFDHNAADRMPDGQRRAFWMARRKPSGRADLRGSSMYLTFLDLDLDPSSAVGSVVYAHTLCTNRGLAEQLAAGARLQVEEPIPVREIRCLTKPTQQLAPPLGGPSLWRLVSQLSLNYLSLTEGPESLRALREILALHCGPDTPSAQQQIAGLVGLSCKPVVRRIGLDAWRGYCRGLEVRLELDSRAYVGSGAFLLASVVQHFLSLYVSINSFVELVAETTQRDGFSKRWPPVVGAQPVL